MPSDPVVLNNAANVRLELGHMESALDLYRRAIEIEERAVVLFNLAQAYGRAFQVEDLNRTLARAQQLDGELVASLTALQGAKAEGFVVDMPLPGMILWKRLAASPRGDSIAAEMRMPLAPGRLGSDLKLAGAVAGAIFLLAALFGARFDPSRTCPRCGAMMCPRCDGSSGGELCDGCTRLFFQPEKTDRNLRLERVNALRDREQRLRRVATFASVLLPGVAGLLARRPLASFLGAFFFVLALASVFWRGGVVPDPLVAGAAAPLAFLGLAAFAGLAYAIVVGTSLARQGS
jgi:tetratricopeptide (TPR) repeat protein